MRIMNWILPGRKFCFLNCILIEFAIPNLIFIYFCISEIFKTRVQNRVCVINSPRLFCSKKKQLKLNARIKAFWYKDM